MKVDVSEIKNELLKIIKKANDSDINIKSNEGYLFIYNIKSEQSRVIDLNNAHGRKSY